MRASHIKKNSRQQKKINKDSPTKNPSRMHARTELPSQPPSRSEKTSFTPNLHNLLAHLPVHTICSASSLPSRRTSTTATQIAGAERFWRRRARRSLETNRSRREPRSKGLFFMIFPFPQFGFQIGCSDFLFASSEIFKFWAFPFWWDRRVSVCSNLLLF